MTKAWSARVAAQAMLKDQLPVPSYAGSKTSRAAAGTSVPAGSRPAWASTIETAVGEHHPAPPTSRQVICERRGTSSTRSVRRSGAEVSSAHPAGGDDGSDAVQLGCGRPCSRTRSR